MESAARVARIFGVDINIHYTWLIVFGLVTWSLAANFFPQQYPGWSAESYWLTGVLSSLLFFASVLVHELSHSLVAMSKGLPVKNITLFIFGGVSNIGRESRRPGDELLMSVAGPFSSLMLAGLFAFLWLIFRVGNELVGAAFQYLAGINLLLAAFNLIPGFPLDGGRVLRAALWGFSGDIRWATQVASRVGQAIAYIMMFGGIFIALGGNFLSGIWLIFIGWFLNNAAEGSARQVVMQESLRGVRVGELMATDTVGVKPDISLREFVDDYVVHSDQRAFPVQDGERLVGLITLTDLKHAPRERWNEATVGEYMTPEARLRTVEARDQVQDVLESLEGLNQLPVMEQGRLVGMVSRSHLIRFLRLRNEFGL